MDIFFADKNVEVLEWVSQENPPSKDGIYKVRLFDGNEVLAYFCKDGCVGLLQYFEINFCRWWDKKNKTPLLNVTHWGNDEV